MKLNLKQKKCKKSYAFLIIYCSFCFFFVLFFALLLLDCNFRIFSTALYHSSILTFFRAYKLCCLDSNSSFLLFPKCFSLTNIHCFNPRQPPPPTRTRQLVPHWLLMILQWVLIGPFQSQQHSMTFLSYGCENWHSGP
uniref:Uncharacterized protein n=1 Tax=Anguilla anguilla TaxID=7936 RepID=A0A0E9X2L7_ANGAN